MTTITIPPDETAEECVNQIANFRQMQVFWLGRGGESTWEKAMACLDAEVQYTLALKERMLAEGRYFIETLTHTAHLEGDATDLNGKTPVVTRKEA